MSGALSAVFAAILVQASVPSVPPPAPPIGSRNAPGGPGYLCPTTLPDGGCALISGAADRANRKLPIIGPNGVKAKHITVDCRRRAYTTAYSLLQDDSRYAAGWLDQAQAIVNATACSSATFKPMIKAGWRVTSAYVLKSGKTVSVTARCPS